MCFWWGCYHRDVAFGPQRWALNSGLHFPGTLIGEGWPHGTFPGSAGILPCVSLLWSWREKSFLSLESWAWKDVNWQLWMAFSQPRGEYLCTICGKETSAQREGKARGRDPVFGPACGFGDMSSSDGFSKFELSVCPSHRKQRPSMTSTDVGKGGLLWEN